MAEVKEIKKAAKKAKWLIRRRPASIPRPSEMLERAQKLGVETVFDRAVTMKPCNIGSQGTCCKNCSMGPCRLPLPKDYRGPGDERKGLCGATANTIAARNFPAWWLPARRPIPTTAAVWPKSSCPQPARRRMLTKSKTKANFGRSRPTLAWRPRWRSTVKVKDRDVDEIALEVAEKSPSMSGVKPRVNSYT
jgi:carbon-monoxide dehydrogenase catalytic subunit